MASMKLLHELYWEDVTERLIYAELDDYAWKLPEKIFGYKKKSSLYIYHDGRLAAYYSSQDSKREAKKGYLFYCKLKNVQKVVSLKQLVFKEVQKATKKIKNINFKKLSDESLRKLLLDYLDLYHKSLSVHYLTQPQFFEKFEKEDSNKHLVFLEKLTHSRFKYTRIAWTKALQLCKKILKIYARKLHLNPEEVESLLYEEIKSNRFKVAGLKKRVKRFVLVSKYHKITVFTGKSVKLFIDRYEDYKNITQAKGVIGNKGIFSGKAFVIKNENLDLSNPPKGMKKGMVLIIQNAWPEFNRYYKQAAAIVTNEGGITSHGVVVAREFSIPCIVGTKIATKIFKTGDSVEVDANRGIVRKIR